ncbi:MAG: sensor histidine kinase [Prolixibacteraceae bacterium]
MNIFIIFIFSLFLFSIKERGDALIVYIVACAILGFEWFFAKVVYADELKDLNHIRYVISNFIVFTGIVYIFYSLIIANSKFILKEFIYANLLIVIATIIFSFFKSSTETIRICMASILMGVLYLIGSIMLIRRFKVSVLQGNVGIFALLLSLVQFYRAYYSIYIDPELTLFKPVPINSITFILFFIENFAVGIIILMIHYEKSKKKIESHNRMLVEVNTTKDKILSVIAHDLKNYFNSILGLTDYLNMADDETTIGTQRKKIQLIKSSSNSAYLLMSNLLEWANAKTENVVFEPSEFYLDAVIASVIETCKPEADIKEISLNVQFQKDVKVCADQNMVRTIVRNLLLNAIKYSYKYNEVMVQIEQLHEKVEIKVIDRGVGMAPEEVERLACQSNYVSKPGTQKEKGNGLGLQICKEFIKLHKSQLNINSQLQKGSVFSFLLAQNCSD